tara:strand:+ start:103 stop:696 length:594 start_codon:yes stop_codon:yes gene_type:complete
MKKFIILLLFVPLLSVAQSFGVEEINITEGKKFYQGKFLKFTPVIVIESEGSASELYQKCMNWLNETYKQPDEVIKGKIEGKYVKINGSTSSTMFQASALGSTNYYDSRYTVEFRFKDNKMRMEVISIEFYMPASQYSVISGWQMGRFTFKVANRKGKPVKDGLAESKNIPAYFENLAISLKDFSSKGMMKEIEDDW